MKGSREVIEMEENGEIEQTEHGYVPVDWEEKQRQDMEEIRNDALYDEEKERRAGFFDVHPDILKLLKDYKNEQNKIDKIDQKIKELKNGNNR